LVDLLALLCAKAFKKYSIVHIHGNEIVTILEGKRGIRYHLLKYTLDISSQIIVLNTFQMAELANIIESDKIFIVSNFSEDKISKSELVGKLAIIPKKKLQILFLSNLMIEKGFLKFLEISNRLGSSFEFVLCGTPIAKDLNNVEKIRKNIYKNYKNIKFLGPVYGEKKNSILKSSDIFFFPSVYATEAQPLVLIEAISFGCGPLVAERPYISDILNKNGLLTVSSDPSTEEIFDLLQNVNQQREKLLNYISGNYENSKNFSVTIFDKKIIHFFKRIESIGT
jgi:glycosyltransferase involved in cell wall biosynthesis